MIKNYQTAIVTGTSRGIGPHIARALAAEGLNLVLAARSAAELDAVAAEVRAIGVKVLAVPTDVSRREARAALVAAAERAFGAVDVLVNNAATEPQREFHRYNADTIESMIQINLTGPIELTRLLLPGMLDRRRGHIVQVSSLAGRMGYPHSEVYAACKDGLVGFNRVLRNDYRKAGVSSSALLLAGIRDTGITARTLEETGFHMSRMNMASLASPEAVARAVVKAIRRDKAEMVVMPGPGKLMKAVLDFFPGMGPWMVRTSGMTKMLKQVADFREQHDEPDLTRPVAQRSSDERPAIRR